MLYSLGKLEFLFLVSNQLTTLPEGIQNHSTLLCVLPQGIDTLTGLKAGDSGFEQR